MRLAIELEWKPDTNRGPDERATQPLRYTPHTVNGFVLQGEVPLHDVACERRCDPPRYILMRTEQQQPARIDRDRDNKRRSIMPLEPRSRSWIAGNGEHQALRRAF